MLSADWDMHRTDWELESQGGLSRNWNRCCWCTQSLPPHPYSPAIFTPQVCDLRSEGRKELEMETKTSDLPWPREGERSPLGEDLRGN